MLNIKCSNVRITLLFCIVTSQTGVTAECRSPIIFNFLRRLLKYKVEEKFHSVLTISLNCIIFLTASLLHGIFEHLKLK